MALPSSYSGQACSLSRTLEIVGERWTLLIVRDAFYGVRRFGDFAAHLQIPRAVLTQRLASLIAAGVLVKVAGEGRRLEYELTDKGVALWPIVRSLTAWGDEYYAPDGARRIFLHAGDESPLDNNGRCQKCGDIVAAGDTVIAPGPGLPKRPPEDPVSIRLAREHRLLVSIRS
jgi:DNA-binding HxlR family transcriptional regulator